MPIQLSQWMEIIFDVVYLIVIWTLTALMYKHRSNLTEQNKTVGRLFILAFFLLALGDTGHVGFRVPAYFLGGAEQNPSLLGLGSLATSITVTFFYMVVAQIWRVRFDKKRTVFWWALMLAGVARLVIMAFPQNQWLEHTLPFGWSLARNIPLIAMGLCIAGALLVWGIKQKDSLSKSTGILIFLSYLFYTPVIVFVREIPALGMLMIPKTIVYVIIAIIAYKALFKNKTTAQ